jgi:hypothetical protein
MKRTAVKIPRRKTGPYTVNGNLAMDVREAARFTGFSESAIRNKIFAGIIPYRKFARRIIFDREELKRWFQQLPGVSVEEALDKIAS